MSYYNDNKNMQGYVKMADGYDGREWIADLRNYLPDGSTVLELGMGPGTDYEILSQHFQVTGSDYVDSFLDRYRAINPSADLLKLDAVTLETERQFDAIYSNKVLYHLSKDDLRKSYARQAELLNVGGIAYHTLWYGDDTSENHGLLFINYTEQTILEMFGTEFEIVKIETGEEMEPDDSLIVVLRKK
ncbi:MAG: cyclopropane fatty-acyl-phospholipid synthase-like methyltransferase [Cellvibrionaceae bacterium]|jgi:cyclopropane fatty-acyl-phospholipid synthase-like methyltransferase